MFCWCKCTWSLETKQVALKKLLIKVYEHCDREFYDEHGDKFVTAKKK